MSYFLALLFAASLLCGALNGQLSAVSAAAMQGAQSAVELCLSMAGALCLWCGVMEVSARCGLTEKLAALCRPLLRRIFPRAGRDNQTMAALSANLSANLLGLGNAATPLGIRAATRMAQGADGVATNELCRLVVMNTASVQLLPTTVAAVRASLGGSAPLDILPAVWCSSVLSVSAGLLMARLLEGRHR